MGVENVKAPLVVTVRLLPLLSCKTSPVPERPETVPPIVYVAGVGVVGGAEDEELPPPQEVRQKEANTSNKKKQVFILDSIANLRFMQ